MIILCDPLQRLKELNRIPLALPGDYDDRSLEPVLHSYPPSSLESSTTPPSIILRRVPFILSYSSLVSGIKMGLEAGDVENLFNNSVCIVPPLPPLNDKNVHIAPHSIVPLGIGSEKDHMDKRKLFLELLEPLGETQNDLLLIKFRIKDVHRT